MPVGRHRLDLAPSPSSPRAGGRRSRARCPSRPVDASQPRKMSLAGLHQPLALDDALPVVGVRAARPTYGSSTDGPASFTWRKAGRSSSRPSSSTTQRRACPTLPTPTDLARHVDERYRPAGGGGRRAGCGGSRAAARASTSSRARRARARAAGRRPARSAAGRRRSAARRRRRAVSLASARRLSLRLRLRDAAARTPCALRRRPARRAARGPRRSSSRAYQTSRLRHAGERAHRLAVRRAPRPRTDAAALVVGEAVGRARRSRGWRPGA